MKTRLLIIIGVIVIGIITVLGIMFIFNFDYSPTMPIVESQLQMVIDYCNDTSEVKNAILYYHSNETHSIDNIDCEWKLHQNYPNSEYLCIPYVEKWVTSEEWRNQTHIFDKDSCKWKKDLEYDELNSKGCPQFCPKEPIPMIPEVENEKPIPLDIASIEDGRIRLYPVDTCAGIDINRLTPDELNQRYPATFTTKSGKTYEIKFLSINDGDLKEMPVISELIRATHQIPFPLNGGITASKGLVENPDWIDYLEWYDEKKTEQFNLDNVRVSGFVYNDEYYSIGFSIC